MLFNNVWLLGNKQIYCVVSVAHFRSFSSVQITLIIKSGKVTKHQADET